MTRTRFGLTVVVVFVASAAIAIVVLGLLSDDPVVPNAAELGLETELELSPRVSDTDNAAGTLTITNTADVSRTVEWADPRAFLLASVPRRGGPECVAGPGLIPSIDIAPGETVTAEVRLSLRGCGDPDQPPEPGRYEVSVRLETGFGVFVSDSVEVEITG